MAFFISYSFSLPKLMLYIFCAYLLITFVLSQSTFCPTIQVAKKYPHCFSPTCGMAFEFESFGCQCTEDDIAVHTAECDPLTNTLNIFYYWKPPATCRSDNITLPQPLLNVPCDVLCSPGEYLKFIRIATGVVPDRPSCVKCPAGRYSIGGGIRYDPPWVNLPPQFDTECSYWTDEKKQSKKRCEPWKATRNYLESGDNFFNMGIESRLWLNIDLAVGGSISFSYKYDGETKYEEFFFEIDGNRSFGTHDPQRHWALKKYFLSSGHHFIQWVYKKDFSKSKGVDRVYIRDVEITGIQPNDYKCISCSPGRYSNAGSRECMECPGGRFANGYGSTFCNACHKWEKSKPGSTKCLPTLECTEFDLAEFESKCNLNGNITVKRPWLQPKECEDDSKKSIIQPADSSELCEPTICREGQTTDMFRLPHKCQECVPGRAGGGIFPCEKCLPGKGSGKFMRYISYWSPQSIRKFNSFADFVTHCLGDCATDGWRSGGRFVDSGAGHGAPSESSLIMKIDPTKDPTPEFLFFTYMLSCKKDTASLLVFFDDSLVKELKCQIDCDQTKKDVRILFPKDTRPMNGMHTIKWTYKKIFVGEMRHGCDSARIYTITTRGFASVEHTGSLKGGSQCENCSPGFYSHKPGQCYSCPSGHFSSDDKNSECKKCPQNTFSHRQGAKVCIPCGYKTTATKDHSQCITDCIFKHNPLFRLDEATFNLKDLSKTVFGPIRIGYNDSLSFYFSICHPLQSVAKELHECRDLIDIGWRSFHPKWEGHRMRHPLAFPIYSCVIHKNEILNSANVGAVNSFESLTDANVVGFQMKLQHGAKLQCVDDDGNVVTKITSTIIKFICSEIGTVQPVDANSDTYKTTSGISLVRCQSVFEWRSLYGCPLCQSTDWTSTADVCDPNTLSRMRTFRWKEPKLCARGLELPMSIAEDCESPIPLAGDEYVFSYIHIWLVILAILVGIFVGCAIIMYFCFEHKRLYSKYRELQETVDTDGIELDELNDDIKNYQN